VSQPAGLIRGVAKGGPTRLPFKRVGGMARSTWNDLHAG
jgi:hypothetical protein